MKRAWRLRATGGRYYAEYTLDDGDTWVSTPPGGFASATAAAQLVVDMKRTDEQEGGITADEKLALRATFDGREAELHDDMSTPDIERAQRLLEWGKWLVERGLVNEFNVEGETDAGQLRGDVAS
jgi:hypothetical protein